MIEPLKGIKINDTEINFEDSLDKVISILGEPEYIQENDRVKKYFYFDSELRFDFKKDNNTLEYIEFLGGYKANVNPILYGVNVYSTLAEDLVDIINKYDDKVQSEEDISKVFINNCISLWRELTPTIYENEIKSSDYSEEEKQEFYKRTMYWERIGIGNKGYFDYLNDRI